MAAVRDTIFAPATAEGRGAIAVVRISGPDAHAAVGALAGGLVAPDRRMRLRRLRDREGVELDDAMVVAFPGGSSPTGEAAAELHLHGGPAVVGGVLAALGRCQGLRPARPGEFAWRAVLSGRMDLAQAEALADLVEAETAEQRRRALDGLRGAVGQTVAAWRRRIVELRATIEAGIDFADEDLPPGLDAAAESMRATLVADLRRERAGVAAARAVRAGFEVAVIGPPNAGKSSLINAIAGREVALVSDEPGTTRDVLEARCDLGGLLVTFLDTAGLREGGGALERAGVARGRLRAEAADLTIAMEAHDAQAVGGLTGDVMVWGKADVARGPGWNVSTVDGSGVDALLCEIEGRLRGRVGEARGFASARQAAALDRAIAELEAAAGAEPAVAAEHARLAGVALETITGGVDLEAVFDEVFARFCIGK